MKIIILHQITKTLTVVLAIIALNFNVCFASNTPAIGFQSPGERPSYTSFPKSNFDSKVRWYDIVLVVAGFLIVTK